MSKNRMINTRFWSDNFVVDELNPHDRYLFLYLLLNERTTISGIYEAPIRTISNETGIEKEEVSRMLKRLEPKVFYKEGWVVITNSIRHQNYKSPKIKAALQREMCNAPAELIELLELPGDLDLKLECPIDTKRYGMDTVSYTKPNLTKPNLTNKSKDLLNVPAKAETKKTLEKVSTEEITEILDYWNKTVQLELGNEAGQRKAIAALIRQRGKDQLKRLIDGVVLALDDQYAPRISDFVSLKRKQNDLLVWGRKRNGHSNVEVI